MLDSPFHLGVVKDGAAHIASFPHVVIDGDRAVATHYTQLLAHQDQGFVCLRLSAHRWELKRSATGWVFTKRSTALLNGDPRARSAVPRHVAAVCGLTGFQRFEREGDRQVPLSPSTSCREST